MARRGAASGRQGYLCAYRLQRVFSRRAKKRPASISSPWRPAPPSPLAFKLTGSQEKRTGLTEAQCAFRWFLGKNDLQVPLYDPTTGGCRDGLHPDRVNENQGAESTLSFLMALLEMQRCERAKRTELHQEMSVSLFESYRFIPADMPQPPPQNQQKLAARMQRAPLFTRYAGNPILSRRDWPYPINSVFNAGAVRLADGDTLLLCRVEDRTGLRICARLARQTESTDGASMPSRRCWPIRVSTPKRYGVSKIRASRMFPNWSNMQSHIPPLREGALEFHSHSPRTSGALNGSA